MYLLSWWQGETTICDFMLLKLTEYIKNVISFLISQEPRQILLFGNVCFFLQNFQFWPKFTANQQIWGRPSLWRHWDVLVTSVIKCLFLFWYLRKEEIYSYTITPNKHMFVCLFFFCKLYWFLCASRHLLARFWLLPVHTIKYKICESQRKSNKFWCTKKKMTTYHV